MHKHSKYHKTATESLITSKKNKSMTGLVAPIILALERPRQNYKFKARLGHIGRKEETGRREKREGPYTVKLPRTTSILFSLSYVDLKYIYTFPLNLSFFFL